MPYVGHLLLKTCVGAIGGLAIYVGCFLYEDEEGKLQNRLEKLSKSMRMRSEAGESLPLVSTVAALVNRILNRILGARLLSWRMAVVSMWLSIGCAGVSYALFRSKSEWPERMLVIASFSVLCLLVAI